MTGNPAHRPDDTRPFALATVLTITTERTLCPLSEVYLLLKHMTGTPLYTYHLVRAGDACRPWLLRWFPALGNVALDTLDLLTLREGPEAGVQAFLQSLRRVGYPATYHVPPLPQEATA